MSAATDADKSIAIQLLLGALWNLLNSGIDRIDTEIVSVLVSKLQTANS